MYREQLSTAHPFHLLFLCVPSLDLLSVNLIESTSSGMQIFSTFLYRISKSLSEAYTHFYFSAARSMCCDCETLPSRFFLKAGYAGVAKV